ncbi:MAG: alpha/beta fold hydrolase [Mycoplasma sp.]|nr:alpha/beta fold hydrolase [Candidatus Hennigella equi]
MNKFEQERINKYDILSKKFAQPIPVAYVTPLSITTDTCVFVYSCGLGGTNSFNLYMNNPIYDNHYFVTYDKMGHGDNKNKPSQYKKKYLYELDSVVDWATQQFPNRKIYLLGESWGCAINFLYLKKYKNKIAGVINWNMPTTPHSPFKKTAWQTWQFAWRELVTIFTNVNLQLPLEQSHYELLTRNRLLIRAMAMTPQVKNSTKLTLAVWRFMRPSYKFMIRNARNWKYNFLYVQTGQDALMTKKHIKKMEMVADEYHYLKIPTGYHILTMELEESKILYRAVQDFINKK